MNWNYKAIALFTCFVGSIIFSNASEDIFFDGYSGVETELRDDSRIFSADSLWDSKVYLNYKEDVTKFKATRFILPTALISYGVISRYTGLKEFDKTIRDELQRNMSTDTWVDDVLWAAPFAAVYGLDWCGVKPVHNFKDRFIVTASSAVIGYGLIYVTKNAMNRWRPDGDGKKSFPSSHTGMAFVGAHILMKEYSYISPWIGVAGYTVATATGFLRMTNNKHWFSDIVGGAGFGILSVELSYLLLPYLSKTFTFGNKKHSQTSLLTMTPVVDSQNVGFGFSYRF